MFGLTSTAFIWSEARRRKTHELGLMPLAGAIIVVKIRYYYVCDRKDGDGDGRVAQKVLSHALGKADRTLILPRRSRRK